MTGSRPPNPRPARDRDDAVLASAFDAWRRDVAGVRPAPYLAERELAAAARGEVVVLTFASLSAVEGLAEALASPAFSVLLASAAVAAIGPTTAAELARRGRPADAVATPATLEGLADAAFAVHQRFSERKLLCRC